MSSPAVGNDDTRPAEAARRGWRAARDLDRELRAEELREREDLLTRLAFVGDLAAAPVTAAGRGSSRLRRLRREHDEQQRFHDTVVLSAGWRLLEGVRRLVGRRWMHPAGWRDEDWTGDEEVRLERRVRELGEFRAALLRSRSWRLLQALRRRLGREW